MTIWVPDIAGPITLEGLIALVNSETGNTVDQGTFTAEGDGASVQFFITPPYRTIVAGASFVCLVGGVEDTGGSMDYTSGAYTFATAPAQDAEIEWRFDYVYWSDALVEAAVLAGIGIIFPYFYNPTTEVLGSTVEHTFVTEGAEVVTMVVSTGASVTRIPRSKYTTYKSGDVLVLRWYGSAPSGTIRAHIVCRPALVGTTLNVTDRAIAPIISYAKYYLLNQKQAERMRADTATATVGQGNLSPRQMNDASNSFFLQYQAQCQQGKQLPWSMS